MKTAYAFRTLPTKYEELVAILPPRPIHTASAYEEAGEMIDALAGHKLNKDQEDYLDAISTFVAEYEDEHHEVPDADAVQVLNFLLEDRGMTRADLGRILGDKSLGYRILSGERKLSLNHIRKLAAHFGVRADLFIE